MTTNVLLQSNNLGPKCLDQLNCLHTSYQRSTFHLQMNIHTHTFICNNGTFFCLVYLFFSGGGKRRGQLKQCLVSASSTFPKNTASSIIHRYGRQYSPGFHDGLNSSVFSEMRCIYLDNVGCPMCSCSYMKALLLQKQIKK